jgi:hypothetical protein
LSIELQTLTRRTAPSGLFRDYPLDYKTFIPYDNVPTPVPGDVCGVFPQLSSIWYGGDYQTFAYTGKHRVQETAVVVPYQSRLASGLRSVAAPHAGLSTAYAANAMLNAPESPTGRWIDFNISPNDPLGDCDKRVRQGRATIYGANGEAFFQPVTVLRSNSQAITARLQGSGSDPVAPFSYIGPIRWDINVNFMESLTPGHTNLQYQVTGYSTCFPAHEVWTENHKLYSEFPASVYNIVPCLTTLGLQPIVPSSGTIQY